MHSGSGPIQPDGIFDGLSASSILIGALVDLASTTVASTPLVLWFAGGAVVEGDEEATARALEAVWDSPEFLAAFLLVGLAATCFGAFVGARRAGRLHVRHGGWVAVASAGLGALLMLLQGPGAGSASPPWYDALSLGLMLPAGLLGGLIAQRRRASPRP